MFPALSVIVTAIYPVAVKDVAVAAVTIWFESGPLAVVVEDPVSDRKDVAVVVRPETGTENGNAPVVGTELESM